MQSDGASVPCGIYYAGAGKARGSYIRVGDAELPMTIMRSTVMKAYRKHVR